MSHRNAKQGDENDQGERAAGGGDGGGPTLGSGTDAGRTGGRTFLLRGEDDRRVLPAFVCGAHAAAGERRILRDGRGRGRRRISPVPAVLARWSDAGAATCRGGGRAVPQDRGGREHADTGGT